MREKYQNREEVIKVTAISDDKICAFISDGCFKQQPSPVFNIVIHQ